MRTVLLTGFSVFPGVADNPTERIASVLDGETLAAATVHSAVLETTLDGLDARFASLVEKSDPAAVLLTGVAEERREICLETHAWNRIDFPRPDASGALPQPAPIDPQGPEFLMGRFNRSLLEAALNGDGGSWRWSEDPGRYLCNALYFTALSRLSVPCVFMHVPLHREAGGARPLAEIRRAVEAVLSAIAAP